MGREHTFVCMLHRPHDGTVLEVLPHVTGVLEAVYGIVGDYLEGINFLSQKRSDLECSDYILCSCMYETSSLACGVFGQCLMVCELLNLSSQCLICIL